MAFPVIPLVAGVLGFGLTSFAQYKDQQAAQAAGLPGGQPPSGQQGAKWWQQIFGPNPQIPGVTANIDRGFRQMALIFGAGFLVLFFVLNRKK